MLVFGDKDLKVYTEKKCMNKKQIMVKGKVTDGPLIINSLSL